jgi:flagellar protein FlaG
MESITITQTAVPVVSTPPTPKSVEIKTVQPEQKADIQIEDKTESIKKAEETTKEFNEISNDLNLDVKFAYNSKIDTVYISVTDKVTGKVIKKLPSEEAMKLKESMQDLAGVLFDKKG